MPRDALGTMIFFLMHSSGPKREGEENSQIGLTCRKRHSKLEMAGIILGFGLLTHVPYRLLKSYMTMFSSLYLVVSINWLLLKSLVISPIPVPYL